MRLAGVPLVVPLGYHCAPSIVNDVLGHDETRPRMRTPFALGVFPPRGIARLLADGLSAGALVGRAAISRADGAPATFAPDETARTFAHGVLVRNERYDFTFNHDFCENGDATGALANHPWVLAAYESKVTHLRALLRSAPARSIVLCTVASPLQVDGISVRVPPVEEVVRDASAALDAMRALAASEGARPDAIAGVVVLYAPALVDAPCEAPPAGPDGAPGAEPRDDELRAHDAAGADGATEIALELLPPFAARELHRYGQIPVPQREHLYRAVYGAFLRAAERLDGGSLARAFPPWAETRFAGILSPPAAGPAGKLRTKPCRFFRNNACHFGDACRYSHEAV